MRCKTLQDGDRIVAVFYDIAGEEKNRLDKMLEQMNGGYAPERKAIQAVKPLAQKPAQKVELISKPAAVNNNPIAPVAEARTPQPAHNPDHGNELRMTEIKTPKRYTIKEIEKMTINEMQTALESCTGKAKDELKTILRKEMFANVRQLTMIKGDYAIRDICKKLLA